MQPAGITLTTYAASSGRISAQHLDTTLVVHCMSAKYKKSNKLLIHIVIMDSAQNRSQF